MSSILIKKKFSVFLFLHRLSNFVIFLRLVIIEYAKEITNKRQKKTEGQSRMDNTEKLATFGYTWHRTKTNKTTTNRYPICGPPFFFNSSLLWEVFIINSVEQLQTLPKTQSEIDISPFLKTHKPSSTLQSEIDISPFLKTQKPSSTLQSEIDISPFLKTHKPSSTLQSEIDISPFLKTHKPSSTLKHKNNRVEEGFCA